MHMLILAFAVGHCFVYDNLYDLFVKYNDTCSLRMYMVDPFIVSDTDNISRSPI